MECRCSIHAGFQHVKENRQIDGSAFRQFCQEQSLTLGMAQPFPRLFQRRHGEAALIFGVNCVKGRMRLNQRDLSRRQEPVKNGANGRSEA